MIPGENPNATPNLATSPGGDAAATLQAPHPQSAPLTRRELRERERADQQTVQDAPTTLREAANPPAGTARAQDAVATAAPLPSRRSLRAESQSTETAVDRAAVPDFDSLVAPFDDRHTVAESTAEARAVSENNPLASPMDQLLAPVAQEPSAAPLSRRSLRKQRETATAAGPQDVKPLDTRALDSKPRDSKSLGQAGSPSAAAASTSRGSLDRRRRAARSVGRNAFSVAAMGFVAAMALATSVPANALLTPQEVAAQKASSSQTATDPDSDITASAQSLDGDGVSVAPIERDGFTAKSFEEVVGLANMRTASTFTNDPNGTVQWPFPVGVPISDFYGWRSSPAGFHHGVDFTPGLGTPIQVIADGVVRFVGTNAGASLGIHVIVDHQIDGQLVSSVYAHMKPGTVKVTEGQHLKVTDEVGEVGDTGFSTGAHLHFEIRLNGTEYTDPFAWMQAHAN